MPGTPIVEQVYGNRKMPTPGDKRICGSLMEGTRPYTEEVVSKIIKI